MSEPAEVAVSESPPPFDARAQMAADGNRNHIVKGVRWGSFGAKAAAHGTGWNLTAARAK
jgi:hypothetical protein